MSADGRGRGRLCDGGRGHGLEAVEQGDRSFEVASGGGSRVVNRVRIARGSNNAGVVNFIAIAWKAEGITASKIVVVLVVRVGCIRISVLTWLDNGIESLDGVFQDFLLLSAKLRRKTDVSD